MARSAPSHANPAMLKWARESERLSIAEVVDAEKLDADDLKAWEAGEGTPSLAVLKRLARRYRRHTMVFYLEAHPTEFSIDKLKDFRVLPKNTSRRFSRQLRQAIRFVRDRQSWASGYFQDEGYEKSSVVGICTLQQSAIEVGRQLRDQLGITLEQQANAPTEFNALSQWRSAVEGLGVFVFQVRGVEVEEMRGFAIADDFAPAVAININDSPTARTFTLIHEVAHILLNETGISGAGSQSISVTSRRDTERFCNAIAAETLVPTNDFIHRVPSEWELHDDEVLRGLSRFYNVSRAVIAFRLFETGFANKEYLSSKMAMLAGVAKKKSRGGPIPQFQLVLARNGRSFSQLAVSAFREGNIHGGALSSLLNMKLKHLPTLETVLSPSQAHL